MSISRPGICSELSSHDYINYRFQGSPKMKLTLRSLRLAFALPLPLIPALAPQDTGPPSSFTEEARYFLPKNHPLIALRISPSSGCVGHHIFRNGHTVLMHDLCLKRFLLVTRIDGFSVDCSSNRRLPVPMKSFPCLQVEGTSN